MADSVRNFQLISKLCLKMHKNSDRGSRNDLSSRAPLRPDLDISQRCPGCTWTLTEPPSRTPSTKAGHKIRSQSKNLDPDPTLLTKKLIEIQVFRTQPNAFLTDFFNCMT